ncbi:ATP-binding protein [Undibacterium sp. RuTC16W]|uniref:ATP-binding protein n=1 Tax=Undibacterium sp. RuTC16W TaxID=3413048 RepID=UPI003BF43D0C
MPSPSPGTSLSQSLSQRLLQRILPQSLLGRLTVVMVAGVMLTQVVGNAFWTSQVRIESEAETKASSQHVARSAASTMRYFFGLPSNYRPLTIQLFREMGGTRFFVNINQQPVKLREMTDNRLTTLAVQQIQTSLKEELPKLSKLHIGFAWPTDLVVSDDGSLISEVPEKWVQHILITEPNPAPILVLQTEMDDGRWLYMATLMPNPYFFKSGDPFSPDRVLLQAMSLAAVLVLSILVVRWTTRPLAALSEAAQAFGKGEHAPPLPETGSKEFVKTARAFGEMRERIQKYIDDRERLFVSISHDLRTPIVRLKLRTELLDDDAVRAEFHDDLDELDMMVKGALQCVKDSDIYENPTEIRLDALLGRMVKGAHLAGHEISFNESGLTVFAKPLAIKRAVGNLLDNAIHYGKQVEIHVVEQADKIAIEIRDHGPGVPEDAFASLFEPYVRLEHGRHQNAAGMGLGLGITRSIVQAHEGELQLKNHPDGGLIATILLPGRHEVLVSHSTEHDA